MASIFELTGAYRALEELAESEPDEEEFKAALAAINDELENKADNYAKLMRNLDAGIDGIGKEIKRLEARKASKENFKNRLKANLFASMKETGKTKFKTDLFSFGIQKNGGKAPLEITARPEDLPDGLRRVRYEADSEAIRAYIEETGDLSYGVIKERGESLRIR